MKGIFLLDRKNSRDASGQRELQRKEVLHHGNRKRRGKRSLTQITNINGRGEGYLQNEKFCNNSQSSENFHGKFSWKYCSLFEGPLDINLDIFIFSYL